MANGFLTVVCFYLSVPMATGLSCIVCSGTSLNGAADPCVDAVTGATTNTQVCSERFRNGSEVRCSVIVGEASVGYVTTKTISRMCRFVTPNTNNTCTELVVGEGVAGATGKRCYCKTDNCNGQTTLAPAIITSLVGLALAKNAVL